MLMKRRSGHSRCTCRPVLPGKPGDSDTKVPMSLSPGFVFIHLS